MSWGDKSTDNVVTPLDTAEMAEKELIRTAAALQMYKEHVEKRANETNNELLRIDAVLSRIRSLQE